MKDKPNKVTTVLKVVVTGEFYDDDATEETLRYAVEQDLEDAGFDVDIAPLKEQEARVLTIEEALVDNNNSIEISPYVFVEIKDRNDIFIGSVHDDIYGDYHSDEIKVRVYRIWMSDSKTYPKADYMKTVRFWNRKPTDEQRQAVKWNE